MSSTLFMYLLALGVIALAALVAHGAWQARKASPRKAEPEQPSAARELREPTMNGATDEAAGGSGEAALPARDAEGRFAAAFVADTRTPRFDVDLPLDPAAGEMPMYASTTQSGNESMPGSPSVATRATAPAPGFGSEPALASGSAVDAAPGDDARPGIGETDAVREPWLTPRRSLGRLDGLIDAIAVLSVESPVSGEMAIAHLPPSRRAGGKPFLIEGLNTDSGEWEPPANSQRYGEFQAGVLLANRTGALNEIEYSEFVQKVQGFADALGALPQFPDMLDVVARARELDAFASQHDAQLAVHLQTRDVAWSVGYVQQVAAKHGFVPGGVPGRLVLPSLEDGAPPVLMLNFNPQAALAEDPNQAAIRDVTLSFDVPQTDAASDPFTAWRNSAEALARDTGAQLIDDNGNAIAKAGFELIGGELRHLYEALEARGLSAGSMAARRLFS